MAIADTEPPVASMVPEYVAEVLVDEGDKAVQTTLVGRRERDLD